MTAVIHPSPATRNIVLLPSPTFCAPSCAHFSASQDISNAAYEGTYPPCVRVQAAPTIALSATYSTASQHTVHLLTDPHLSAMIIDEVPGLKVAVQMGGVDVKEYDAPEAGDDDQDCPTLTKYIECIDDAFFAVRYRVNGQYRFGDHKNPHSLRFKIKVDGRWIRSNIIGSKVNGTCQGRDVVDNMGSYKIQRLQFATIKTGRFSYLVRLVRAANQAAQLTMPRRSALRTTPRTPKISASSRSRLAVAFRRAQLVVNLSSSITVRNSNLRRNRSRERQSLMESRKAT